MKKILFIAFPLIMLTCDLKGQSTAIPDYKNSVSIDVGSFVMANYHLQIIRKNRYALQAQAGIGSYYESKINYNLSYCHSEINKHFILL